MNAHSNALYESMQSALNYIKSRHHPEKPHISLLSPPSAQLNPWTELFDYCKTAKKFTEIEEEEEEEAVEEVTEQYVYRHPGHIIGVEFTQADIDQGSINAGFSFFIRNSYDYDNSKERRDDAYTKIKISAELSRSKLTLSLNAERAPDETRREIISGESIELGTCTYVFFAVLPVGFSGSKPDAINKLAERIINLLVAPLAKLESPNSEVKAVFLTKDFSRFKREVAHQTIDIIGCESCWPFFQAEVYSESDESPVAKFTHAFGLLIGACRKSDRTYLVKLYLINLGGILDYSAPKSLQDKFCRNPANFFTFNPKEKSRWALGYLMEVEGFVESVGGCNLNVEWKKESIGVIGAHTINAMLVKEKPNRYIIRDCHIEEETLPRIREGSSVDSFFDRLSGSLPENCEVLKSTLRIIAKVLKEKENPPHGIQRLYKYQEESIEKVLNKLGVLRSRRENSSVFVIGARTAGGKTLSFLIPAVLYVAYKKLCKNEETGVKTVFIYPTKALANDQLEEVAHMLYWVNQEGGPKLTFGLFHGNIKYNEELASYGPEVLPLKCPEHHTQVEVSYERSSNSHAAPVVSCKGSAECKFARFLQQFMRKTRDEVYSDPPDILITDEDMLNRVLSHVSKNQMGLNGKSVRWYEWQLLGAPYKKCSVCGHTYPRYMNLKKCYMCGSDKIESFDYVSKPSLIVIDEAHQLTGSFGAQTHHLLSLAEHVIKKLGGEKPTYMLSSATIGSPKPFVKNLLGVDEKNIELITAELDLNKSGVEEPHKRYFVFIMPKAYSQDSTCGRVADKFIEEYMSLKGSVPRGIVFTNTLEDSNTLINVMRLSVRSNVKIGGHTTDWETDRVEVENKFKSGSLDMLVATSTLEVGVDYGSVDYVTVFGMPSSVVSFLQRIGRAGRNRDAVVFVLFDPDRNVDYYFFENYKILSDGSLREGAVEKETYPVSPDNDEVIRRALYRYVGAYVHLLCCSGENNACTAIISSISEADRRIKLWREISDHAKEISSALKSSENKKSKGSLWALSNYLPESLRLLAMNGRQERREFMVQLIGKLLERLNDSDLKEYSDFQAFMNHLCSKETLYSLRGSDVQVSIKFKTGSESRTRDLRYMLKHALPGQIIAYKGLFFTVHSLLPGDKKEFKEWIKETENR
ncbi:MAG: DEAD/DEAH box helicase [Thermoproteota archaeon]